MTFTQNINIDAFEINRILYTSQILTHGSYLHAVQQIEVLYHKYLNNSEHRVGGNSRLINIGTYQSMTLVERNAVIDDIRKYF